MDTLSVGHDAKTGKDISPHNLMGNHFAMSRDQHKCENAMLQVAKLHTGNFSVHLPQDPYILLISEGQQWAKYPNTLSLKL